MEEGDGGFAASTTPMNRVPYPTADMSFATAKDIGELNHFVISDPRMVLYDLASGTQLVRAYYERPEQKAKKTRRSAVRVYVCDASGSMRGHRARFRETPCWWPSTNNLSLKAQQEKEFWPIYYCFFNDQPMPLRRIDSAIAAYDAIAGSSNTRRRRGAPTLPSPSKARSPPSTRRAVTTPSWRGPPWCCSRMAKTRSMSSASRRRGTRWATSRATLNFISLGDGNADLRQLVLEQRQFGKRAFYSHLSDPEFGGGCPSQVAAS